jgi:hypothetical protein
MIHQKKTMLNFSRTMVLSPLRGISICLLDHFIAFSVKKLLHRRSIALDV